MRLSRAVLLRATPIAIVLAAAVWVARVCPVNGWRPLDVVHAEDRAALRSAQQPSASATTLKVYSRETIVDVTVTDAKGNPVHGLTRDDFTVKEDGKPQAIKSFEEFGARSAPVAAQELPKRRNLQPSPASPALNILLLDFVNAAPELAADCCMISPCPGNLNCDVPSAGPEEVGRAVAAQRSVKRAAIDYLQHMPAGARGWKLMGCGGQYPTRSAGFTSDPALLSAAVDTMNYDTASMVAAGSADPSTIAGKPGLGMIRAERSGDATDALLGAPCTNKSAAARRSGGSDDSGSAVVPPT